MGLQLIFVVETNKRCKSDWIYIKTTIDRFYDFDRAHIKLSPVYMDGKAKYEYREKEVKSLIDQYKKASPNNKSVVIYCFDCDNYDNKPEDAKFLKDTQVFCKERGYEYVWFCKDIERVYLEREVPDHQKKKEAGSFMAKKQITKVEEDRLSATSYKANTSNILRVLDNFIPPLTRKKLK